MGDATEAKAIVEAPFPLTEVDKWVLSQTDEEFKKHNWEELRDIIEKNKLETLKRKPSDLRRYMQWTAETKAEYGSMTRYILVNRLPKTWGEPPFSPASSVPFADSSDYKVLLNDWPAAVQSFVQRHFIDALGPGGKDRVLWFKNWVALQSVRTLEHFHVMVRDVDDDMLEQLTGERPKR
ncbi:hypothetical protein B0I35DRAFT_480081 [Stachybotrys elegans]|uniref:N-acetylglucosamine-induced protein 1 n=1 Tax=Stachybotrys elegans TaxID=80388 RepID=A0A8K0SSX9_9HYPO|nr:hypothetical protein B0I35DRAFT_480081 [Stachybotrys elegans]